MRAALLLPTVVATATATAALGAWLVGPVGAATSGDAAPTSRAARQVEGTVVAVDRGARVFSLRDSERGTFPITVTPATRYERIAGFTGLRPGMSEVEAVISRSGDSWVAREVERSGGGGRHGGNGERSGDRGRGSGDDSGHHRRGRGSDDDSGHHRRGRGSDDDSGVRTGESGHGRGGDDGGRGRGRGRGRGGDD